MGKASRNKRDRRGAGPERQVPPWSPAPWAKHAADLLHAIRAPHPCLLSVMMTAAHQHIGDVRDLIADDDPDAAALKLATLSLGSGIPAEQWLQDMTRLGEDMTRVESSGAQTHRALLERMHRLLHHGKAYPAHAEAYVISPQMHNVVMAASMTVTPEDLFTLDPATDPPTPAGLLLLPAACGNPHSVFAPVSAIGWRPQPGKVLQHSSTKPGVWVEGWSLRRDVDRRSLWVLAVQASRIAGVASPPGLPFSHDWLLNGDSLTGQERAALIDQGALNRFLQDARLAESAEYDPQRDTEFRLGAYAFAFWRLCAQTVSETHRHDGRPLTSVRSPDTGPGDTARPVDRVRVVRLRPATGSAGGDGAPARRYHHRWPVQMHKVKQFYPSQGTHKVIWRGPYIKGPDGAPLLVGQKAQAIT